MAMELLDNYSQVIKDDYLLFKNGIINYSKIYFSQLYDDFDKKIDDYCNKMRKFINEVNEGKYSDKFNFGDLSLQKVYVYNYLYANIIFTKYLYELEQDANKKESLLSLLIELFNLRKKLIKEYEIFYLFINKPENKNIKNELINNLVLKDFFTYSGIEYLILLKSNIVSINIFDEIFRKIDFSKYVIKTKNYYENLKDFYLRNKKYIYTYYYVNEEGEFITTNILDDTSDEEKEELIKIAKNYSVEAIAFNYKNYIYFSLNKIESLFIDNINQTKRSLIYYKIENDYIKFPHFAILNVLLHEFNHFALTNIFNLEENIKNDKIDSDVLYMANMIANNEAFNSYIQSSILGRGIHSYIHELISYYINSKLVRDKIYYYRKEISYILSAITSRSYINFINNVTNLFDDSNKYLYYFNVLPQNQFEVDIPDEYLKNEIEIVKKYYYEDENLINNIISNKSSYVSEAKIDIIAKTDVKIVRFKDMLYNFDDKDNNYNNQISGESSIKDVYCVDCFLFTNSLNWKTQIRSDFNQKEAIYNWLTNSITLKLNEGLDTEFDLTVPIAIIVDDDIKYSPTLFNKNISNLIKYLRNNFSELNKEESIVILKYKLINILNKMERFQNQRLDYDDEYINNIAHKYYDIISLTLDKLNKPIIDFKNAKQYSHRLNEMLSITEEENKEYYERFVKNYNYLSNVEKYKLLIEYREIKEKNIPYLMITNSSILRSLIVNDVYNTDEVSLKDRFPKNKEHTLEKIFFYFIENKIIFYDTSYYTKDTSSIYNSLSMGIRRGKDEDATAMAINSATKDVEYLNELLNEFIRQLDDETKENLSLKYNDYIFNSINGDYNKIPIAFTHSLYFKSEISKGSNKYRLLKLNIAQQRGIRKAILNGDYAIGHEVGVGKTIEAIVVAMMHVELYNTRKITIFVPVKVYEKWEKEIVGIYNDNKKNGEIGYVFFGVLSGVENVVLTKLGNLNEDEIVDKIYVLPDDKKLLVDVNQKSKKLVSKIIDTIINFDYNFNDNNNIIYELSKSKYLYKLGSYNPDVHYSNIYKIKLSEDTKQKFLDIIKGELFVYNTIAKYKIETDKIFNENNELQLNYIYDCILKSNEQLLNIFNIFNKDENKYDKLNDIVKSIINTIHSHINTNYKHNSKKDFYYVEKISILKETLYNNYMITDNIFEYILKIFVYVQLINNKDSLFNYIRKVSLDSDNKRNKEILDKWNKRAKKLGVEDRDGYFLNRYEIFDLEDFELKYFTESERSALEKIINVIIDFLMLYSLYRYKNYLYKTYGEYSVYKDNSKIYINLIKDSGISNLGVGSIDFMEFINENNRILTNSGILNDVISMYLENANKIINFTSLKSDILIYDEAHKYNKYVKNLDFNVFSSSERNDSMIENTTMFEIFDKINSNIKLSSFRKASFKVFLLNNINYKYNYYYKGKKSYNLILTATPFKNNVLEIMGFLGLVNSKFLSEINYFNLYSFGSMFFDTKFINEVSGTAQIRLVPSVEKISNPSIFNQILGCYVDLLSAEGVVKRPKKITIPFNSNEYPTLPNNYDINIIGNKLRPTILQQVLLDAIIDIVNELHDLTDNATINLKFDSIYNDIASITNSGGNDNEQTKELIRLLNRDFDLRYLYNFNSEEEKNSFNQTILNFISIIKDLILDYYVFAGVENKDYTYIKNRDRYINVLNALKEFYRNNNNAKLEKFIYINSDITKYVKKDLVSIKRYINMLAMVGTRYVSLSPAIFNFINIPLFFKPNNDENNLTDYEKGMLELKERIIYYIDKLNMYEYKINGFKYFSQNSIRDLIKEGDKNYYEFVVNSSIKLRYVVNTIRELYEFAKTNNIDKKGIVLYLNIGLSGSDDIYRITDTSVSKCIIDYILNNNIVSSKSFFEKLKYNENDDEDENENNKKSSKDGVSLKEIEELIGSTNNKKREAIIQAFNEGRVKIVVTSVKEAVDLNGNTIALFNLSVDWNYTDNVQIEGRVHRQGNRNGYVTIIYPCVYNSGDVIMWEKLYQKKNRYKNINIYDLTQVTKVKDDETIENVSNIEDMISSVSMLSKYIFVKSVTDAISRYSTISSNINTYEKILNVLINYDYAFLNLKYKYYLIRDINYYDMFYSKLFTKNRDIEFISNNYIQNKSILENSINRLKKQIEKYFTFLNDNNLIKLNKKEYDYDSITNEYKKLLDDFVSLIIKYRDESSTTIPLLNKRGINIEINKIYEIMLEEYNKGEEYEQVIKNKILNYLVLANNNDENKFNIDKYIDFVYDLSDIIYSIIVKSNEIKNFSEQYKGLAPEFSDDFLKTLINRNDIDIQEVKDDFVDALIMSIEKEKDSRNILNKFIDDFIEYIQNYNQIKNINDKIKNINKNIELYKQRLSNDNDENTQDVEQTQLEFESNKESITETEGGVISIKKELKETKEAIENKLSLFNKELEKYTNLLNDINNENIKQRNYLVSEYGEYFDIINNTAREFGKILKEKLNDDKLNEEYINNKENEFNEIKFTTEENIKEYIRTKNTIENLKNRIDDVKNEFKNILFSQLDLLNKNYDVVINENYNDSETKIKLYVNSNDYFIFEGNRFDIAKLHTAVSNNVVVNQTYEINKKYLTYQYYVLLRSLVAFKNVVNELKNKDDKFKDKYNDIDIFVNNIIDIIKNEIQNILLNENNNPLSFNKVGEDYLINKIYEKMPKDITNYFAYFEYDYYKLDEIKNLDENDRTLFNNTDYILSYIFKNKIDIDIRTINLSYKYFRTYENLNEHINSLIREKEELLEKYKFLEHVKTEYVIDYEDLSKLAINTINIDVVKEYMKMAIEKIENNFAVGETYESMKEKTIKLLSYIYNIPAEVDEYVDYEIISDSKEKEITKEEIVEDSIGVITSEITEKEIFVEDDSEEVTIIDNNEIIENIKKEEDSRIKEEDKILDTLSEIKEILDKYNTLYSYVENNKNLTLIRSIKSKIDILNLYSNSLKNEKIKYNFIKNNEAKIIDNLNKFKNFVNFIYKVHAKN